LFVRQGTLFAQRFDAARLELAGTPTLLVQGVITDEDGAAAVSTSAAGLLAFRTGASGVARQLIWSDRSGKALEALRGLEGLNGPATSLSPDGTRFAFSRAAAGTSDIWVLDIARGVPSRLTFEPASEVYPVWSPDGTRIAYSSNPKEALELFVKRTTGSQQARRVGGPAGAGMIAEGWSADGRYILYSLITRRPAFELWAAPVEAGSEALRLASGALDGQFSPDGKWVAYFLDESGRNEIFIQPFPGPGDKRQVSVNGGVQPRWRADGKELFFLAPDNRLMVVPIFFAPPKPPMIGQPASLFSARLSGSPQGPTVRSYSVSRDGQRFLLDTPSETNAPVTMILNWKPKP
jgi:dipeptidyl aminopeptidase/acylaminoacyl peptidase